MTEDEARAWIRDRFDVSRETALESFVELLTEASATQNLIAPSTLETMWSRHIVDSAQLLDHAPAQGRAVDIGSGAGLPGLIIAILRDDPIELVEPRPLRTNFLSHAVAELGLSHVTVKTGKIEQTRGLVDIILARAVSNLDKLLTAAIHRSKSSTTWILPKGRNAQLEVDEAKRRWHGSFHVEQSLTAPDSLIVIAQGIRRR